MKLKLTTVSSDYTESQVASSIMELLRKTQLCSLATVSHTEHSSCSSISTAFYCYTPNLDFYILTDPKTQHGQNLADNNSIALAIYDSHQVWDSPKQGLQLSGTAHLADEAHLKEGMQIYLEQYPGLRKWIQTPEEIVKIDGRFYQIVVSRIKVFDEPKFGSEVWIDIIVER